MHNRIHVPLRAAGAGFAAALLLAAGCSNSSSTTTSASSAPANSASTPAASSGASASGAATYHVGVDGNRSDLGMPVTESFLAYYPKSLTVHAGDTVEFGLNDSGEPHTVALGKLITAAAAEARAAAPHANPGPAQKAVPQLLPQGPGDAIQAAAQPCYQASGPAPLSAACPVHTGEFTGSESLVSSGWLASDQPFRLKISSSAAPGTYAFYCQLHGPVMSGTLTIAPTTVTVPTPAAVAATGLQQLQRDAAQLGGAAGQFAAATPAHAFAGGFSRTFQNGQLDAFAPKAIHIPVGGSVSWTIFGPHSIYFNAPTDAQGARLAAPDGSVHINKKAAAPIGGPGGGPNGGLVNAGSWNGVGPHSSGLILSFPPQLTTYRLQFTKAGSYPFMCTIHVAMKGVVTVG